VSAFRDLDRRYQRLLEGVWQLFVGPGCGALAGIACPLISGGTPPILSGRVPPSWLVAVLVGCWAVSLWRFIAHSVRNHRLVRNLREYGQSANS
jgi:hypothetical protein